jgi:hypothetical protein
MASIASTERADYSFTVKEWDDGSPWIMLEPKREDLKILKPAKAFLGFDLMPGTSLEEAERIAHYLNSHIRSLACTTFS